MRLDRREFIHLTAGGVASGAILSHFPSSASGAPSAARVRPLKAVAFDAFPIFDPRPVFALAETLFPGKGTDLGSVWRARQFEYQWLRALSADFLQTTEEGWRSPLGRCVSI
jgi:2-haloacid dehalogenase